MRISRKKTIAIKWLLLFVVGATLKKLLSTNVILLVGAFEPMGSPDACLSFAWCTVDGWSEK